MKMLWKAGIVGALILGVTTTWAQEQKFKVYGFADLQISKMMWESKNNPLLDLTTYNEDVNIGIEHLNLYFDFAPNDKTRAFAEFGFSQNVKGSVIAEPGATPAIIKMPDGSLMTAASAPFYVAAVAQQAAAAGQPLSAQDQAILQGTYEALLAQSEGAATTEQKNEFEIERVWFDIFVNPLFNVRIGKFITPAGLWNVDHGSPVIIPVTQPYQTSVIPVFPEKQTGLMAYGGTYVGDHEVSYNAWATSGREESGTSDVPYLENNIENVGHLSYGGHVALNTDGILDQLKWGVSGHYGLTRKEVKTKHFELEAADVLTMSTAVNTANYFYDQEEIEQRREMIIGTDLSIEHMNVLVKGEFNYRTDENEITGKSTDYTGYYGLLGYNIYPTDQIMITPFAMYESLTWNDLENTPNMAIIYVPFGGFKTMRLGAKIGLFYNTFLKFEYTMTDIVPRDLTLSQGGQTIVRNYEDKDMDVSSWSAQFSIAF
ncbi:MAG: hypothetical protein OCD01_09175 [Fibrobacterales bacterium]